MAPEIASGSGKSRKRERDDTSGARSSKHQRTHEHNCDNPEQEPPLAGVSFFSKEPQVRTKEDVFAKAINLVATSALDYQTTVQELPDLLKEEKAAVFAKWALQFPKWRHQLRVGFSLLCHGYGSKRALMDAFGKELTDGALVVVNAWRPGAPTTAKQIAVATASALLDQPQAHFRSKPSESVLSMLEECANANKRVYVIINNLDAPSLRTPSEQAILARLASCKCVHLTATVDHINAAALFDKRLNGQFKWLWHHVPTFEPMLVETLGVAPALAGCKQDATQRSACIVLKTLSQSSREVFRVLVDALVDDLLGEDEVPEGITYERLFRLCRERFLVSSDVTLKAHLTEFKDHELVKTRRGADGIELLYVPLRASKLQEVVDDLATEDDRT